MSITTQARLMEGISDAARSVLTQHQIPHSTTHKICWAIVNQLTHVWEGNLIYITKTPDHEVMHRNQCIFDEFKGNNHDVLAEKYGVSIQWIYRIVKEMREDYIHRYQPDMFTPYEPDSEDISNFIREHLRPWGKSWTTLRTAYAGNYPKPRKTRPCLWEKKSLISRQSCLKGFQRLSKRSVIFPTRRRPTYSVKANLKRIKDI